MLTLISNHVCPFAHRARLALEEAGAAYTLREESIAKGAKSAAFTADFKRARGADASSDGQVPVLIAEGGEADGSTLYLAQSNVIVEYVLQRFAPVLLPASPLERARTTLFLESAGAQIVRGFYSLLAARGSEAEAKAAAELDAALARMDAALAESSGPLLLGATPSLADISIFPFLGARFCVLEHYRSYRVPAACERVAAWIAAMRARPAARRIERESDAAFFIDGYKGYALG